MERQASSQAEHLEDFEELVSPHLPGLLTLARRFTHDTAVAQDLVQDTLLKAYRFFHRFEAGTNLWAWLMTIMRNLYFSKTRKQAREAILVDLDRLPFIAEHSVVKVPEIPSSVDLNTALPFLVTDDVLEALDNLPADYRTAVLMADLLELPYKEIATRMECPIGTVMSRLHRGRKMLQQRLQGYAVAHGYIRADDEESPQAATALETHNHRPSYHSS
jgi:RNA polymerase sigma-70 factor (ECF subfamily)